MGLMTNTESCPCGPCLTSRCFDLAYVAPECERYAGHPQRESLEEAVARLLRLTDDVVGVRDIAERLGGRFSLTDVATEVYGTLAALADEGVRIPRVYDARHTYHRRLRCGACRCEVETSDRWCPLADCGAEYVTTEGLEAGKVAAE